MILLLAFAFVAGAATAITPCVLPVLPALLSASGTGGRRRPLGIVAGLTLTHTITIVGIASVVDGVGVGDGTLRNVAIAFLALFGITLLVPPAAEWVQLRLAFLSRLAPRGDADGFWSGLPVGGALGFVYAPCAGPILAAVISVSASSGTTAKIVAVGVAYGLGSALVLLGLALGGRKLIDRVRRGGRGQTLQRGFGAVMVLTAVLMFTSVDLRFQEALASHFPSFLTNPTGGLEKTRAVKDQLAELHGRKPKFEERDAASSAASKPSDAALPGVQTPDLPVLGEAPEFSDAGHWFNTPPLTMAKLRGRVVLIDFWTYTCINCLRTLPYLKAWDARYRDQGLTIVGVHTPEFAFERKESNVRGAIGRQGLRYPVVQDNAYGIWNAFGNQYWPANYLIDARGRVRYVHFGEGKYERDRGGDPLAAQRGRRSQPRRGGEAARTGRDGRPARDAGDVSRQRAGAELLSRRPDGRHAHVRRGGAGLAAAERLQPRRALACRPRVRPRGARRDDQGARRRQGRLPRAVVRRATARATSTSSSTAVRSPAATPVTTCATAS